jgi:hypothetical protein
LTVAALWDFLGYPCLLHWMQTSAPQAFDGRDRCALGVLRSRYASSDRRAVDVHGASPALAYAAAIFGAG